MLGLDDHTLLGPMLSVERRWAGSDHSIIILSSTKKIFEIYCRCWFQFFFVNEPFEYAVYSEKSNVMKPEFL